MIMGESEVLRMLPKVLFWIFSSRIFFLVKLNYMCKLTGEDAFKLHGFSFLNDYYMPLSYCGLRWSGDVRHLWILLILHIQ